jgi:hypothetical protein
VKSTALVLWVLFGAAIVSAQQQTTDTVTDISAISIERHGWFPGPLQYTLMLRPAHEGDFRRSILRSSRRHRAYLNRWGAGDRDGYDGSEIEDGHNVQFGKSSDCSTRGVGR